MVIETRADENRRADKFRLREAGWGQFQTNPVSDRLYGEILSRLGGRAKDDRKILVAIDRNA